MVGENFSLRESQLIPIALMTDPNGLLAGGGGGLRTDQISYASYRAINSGVGYSEGDVLRRFLQFDSVTLAPTANDEWLNISTNTFFSGPLNTDIIALDSFRLPLTSETINVSNVAVGLTTIPVLANRAEIQVHDANIVFTYDGTTIPSSSPDIGIAVQQGNLIILQSRDELLNFNTIRQTASDARIYVQYLQSYCG